MDNQQKHANTPLALKPYNNKFIFILLFGLILSIGISLRIYKLGHNDLWFDEAMSVHLLENIKQIYDIPNNGLPYGNPASESWKPTSFPYRSLDPQPPLYYSLLYLWTNLFGNNEFVLRLLSALLSILSIPLIYKFGTVISNRKVGLWAAFLISISPFHIWYAQEVRGYSLSIFLTLLGAYFLFLALKKNTIKLWSGFIITTILAIYANYFSSYIVLAGWPLFLLKKYRSGIKRWLAANALILISFLPWTYIFLQHILYVKETFWIIKPSLFSILITFKNFSVGYNSPNTTFLLSSMVFFSLLFFGIFCLEKEKKAFLLAFLFIPITATFLISQKIPIYLDRQLMLFSPFYYLIIAKGITNIKYLTARIIVVILILLFIIPSLINYFTNYMPIQDAIYHQGAFTKKPFKPAINYIEENWQEGDVLIYGHISIHAPFKYHQKQYSLKQNDKNRTNYKRIWLISSSWPRDGQIKGGGELLRTTLAKRYTLLKNKEFDGIFIDLYEINYQQFINSPEM